MALNSPHVSISPSWIGNKHFSAPSWIYNKHFAKSKRKESRQLTRMGYKCETNMRHAKDIVRLMDTLNINQTGFQPGLFNENNLLSMYAKYGNLADARQVFDKMPKRNKVSWSAIIAGYAENGFGQEALAVFQRMRKAGVKPNHITFVSVVQACTNLGDLEAGMQVHAWIVKNGFQANLHLGTALVDLYCNCGNLAHARDLFDEMSEKDVVSWTAMIAGYSQQGYGKDALILFDEMRQVGVTPNDFTIASVIRACTGLSDIQHGRGLHAYAIKIGVESDVFVGSALVNMYAKCGSLADARKIFNQIPQRDEVLWNTMITACLQWGCGEQARILLNLMHLAGAEPKKFIVNSVMSACGRQ